MISDPALHRSSYSGNSDPISDWRETCNVLSASIENLVDDCLRRGTSLVLEGVHVVPGDSLIKKWVASGGVAVGCVLHIPDSELHRKVIFQRGVQKTKGAEEHLNRFTRIRAINDEMVRLGSSNDWMLIEQRPIVEARPIDIINEKLQNNIWEEGVSKSLISKGGSLPFDGSL